MEDKEDSEKRTNLAEHDTNANAYIQDYVRKIFKICLV